MTDNVKHKITKNYTNLKRLRAFHYVVIDIGNDKWLIYEYRIVMLNRNETHRNGNPVSRASAESGIQPPTYLIDDVY